jgi:hypothetical protein
MSSRERDDQHGDCRPVRAMSVARAAPQWRQTGPSKPFDITAIETVASPASTSTTTWPGGGDVSQLIWSAAENTGPIALAIALAAGCWWV